jgi:hypothetical protein
LDTLFTLPVGTTFEGAGVSVGHLLSGLGNWIGHGMLDVPMVLPSVDDDRAPKETMGIAIVEELRRETA